MASFPFQPSNQAPFQFQPVLDGKAYLAVVTWNIFGQRWYFNLFAGNGQRLLTEALVASPTGIAIQTIQWDLRGTVTVTTNDRHGYKIGSTLDLTISNAMPAAYNGRRLMLVTGPDTLTFPMGANPGQAVLPGSLSYDINLVWGYGFDSAIVFRAASQAFEVN